MKFLLALVLGVAAAAPNINARSGLPEGSVIKPMTWTGPIEKNGTLMSFNGTIQEVTAQIQEIKPGFTWQGLAKELGVEGTPDASKSKRDDKWKGERICNVGGKNGQGALVSHIQEQRDYLYSLSNVTKHTVCYVEPTPPGQHPSTCSQVSCSNNAAVWLCNDMKGKIGIECVILAPWVDDIANNCQEDHAGDKTARGQVFQNEWFYNVIVGYDDC